MAEKPTYIRLVYPCPYGCGGHWFKIVGMDGSTLNLECRKCGESVKGVFSETMPTWNEVYVNRLESGFYDQVDPSIGQPASELTVPIGFTVHYLHKGAGDFPRPEMDKKETPQPEVYEGRFSANGFYLSAPGRFGLVSDRIYVNAGEPLRATAMYMHVFNGSAAGGSRLGIVMGDGPFNTDQTAWPKGGVDPFNDGAIVWGGWRGTYVGDTPNRQWVQLATPEAQGGIDFVRLVVQFNADTAGEGSHGHWDLFRLEAFTEEETPLPQPNPDPDNDVLAAIAATLSTIQQNQMTMMDGLDRVPKRGETITL